LRKKGGDSGKEKKVVYVKRGKERGVSYGFYLEAKNTLLQEETKPRRRARPVKSSLSKKDGKRPFTGRKITERFRI